MAYFYVSSGNHQVTAQEIIDGINNGTFSGTANFQGLVQFSNTVTFASTTSFTGTATFNSTAQFNSSVDFAGGNVTFNNVQTFINTANTYLGDSSTDIVFGFAQIRFYNTALTNYARFDMSNLTGNRPFKFPDFGGGTLAVLERANTWTATQTFTAATGIQVDGVATFNGNVNLGDAAGDLIVVNGLLGIIGGVDWQAGTATTATAGARTLPSNPDGFLVVQVSGVNKKVPYYNN